MRKFAIIACVMVAGTGVAMAGSLNVPFFLDSAPASGNFPPTSGTASFIALHNNLNTPIEVQISYFEADGTPQVPTNNTFILTANTSISFRPKAHEPTVEGVGSIVPNMPGTKVAGSAVLTWVGDPSDIQGRVAQSAASSSSDTFGFLLPPGL